MPTPKASTSPIAREVQGRHQLGRRVCRAPRPGMTGPVGAGAATGSAAGQRALPPAMPLVEAIARIGAERAATPQPRPAPFYLRGADAAPPSDPPPVILP